MRRCSKCREQKSREEFSPSKNGRDGLDARCRACRAEASRRWHAANTERSRGAFREYFAAKKLPPPLVWIYEFWSADGRCLYVGKTDNLNNRMRFHRNNDHNGGRGYRERAWTVLRMAVDPEAQAILERRPLYNDLGN